MSVCKLHCTFKKECTISNKTFFSNDFQKIKKKKYLININVDPTRQVRYPLDPKMLTSTGLGFKNLDVAIARPCVAFSE